MIYLCWKSCILVKLECIHREQEYFQQSDPVQKTTCNYQQERIIQKSLEGWIQVIIKGLTVDQWTKIQNFKKIVNNPVFVYLYMCIASNSNI